MGKASPLGTRREYALTLSLLGPLCFLLFHLFVFGFWFYWKIAADVAVVVPSLVLLVAVWRLGSMIPMLGHMQPKGIPKYMQVHSRSITRITSILEILFWYAFVAFGYWHLVQRFGFPESLPRNGGAGLRVLLVGYGAYFVVALLVSPIYRLIVGSFSAFALRLLRIRLLATRVATVFVTYLGIDLIFAAVYRLIELNSTNGFSRPLDPLDAIYFSTVVITTLGFGEITPETPTAKLAVTVEALSGIFLLGIFLAAALSFPGERAVDENASNSPE